MQGVFHELGLALNIDKFFARLRGFALKRLINSAHSLLTLSS
jgi:hypothetical protein